MNFSFYDGSVRFVRYTTPAIPWTLGCSESSGGLSVVPREGSAYLYQQLVYPSDGTVINSSLLD